MGVLLVMEGINGRILKVDLSKKELYTEVINKDLYKEFFGGSALAAVLWLNEANLHIEPLSPENPLIFMTGLLTGTPVYTACKASVCAKSPLTGLWSESTIGGFWPKELKWAGYDGIIIKGCSKTPVLLYIESGGAEIIPADDIWGKDTFKTTEIIKERINDDKAEVIAIGPAGENLVRFASIIAGGHEARAAGRTGMGAVMGAKKLKAIAVRGKNKPSLHDFKALQELLKEIRQNIVTFAEGLQKFGTAGGVQSSEATGDLPIKNWQLGSWPEGAAKVCGQAMAKEIVKRHSGCFSCPIRCSKIVQLRKGPYADTLSHGPEYETIAGFGSMLLVDDMDWVATCNDLCNRYGLDTMSTSHVIAMAMEAKEKGVAFNNEDLPSWGDGEAISKLIKNIANRQGVGEILGEGGKRIIEIIGKEVSEYLVECKGLEMAYHDPRAFTSSALGYATANRGACHLEALPYYVEGGAFKGQNLGFDIAFEPHGSEKKAELVVRMQNYLSLYNALGLCKFLLRAQMDPKMLRKLIWLVAGYETDAEALLKTGERFFNYRRVMNNALGISRKDDILSPRVLISPRKTGGAAYSLPHLGRMLNEYYDLRGWTDEGVVSNEKIKELGLTELLNKLKDQGISKVQVIIHGHLAWPQSSSCRILNILPKTTLNDVLKKLEISEVEIGGVSVNGSLERDSNKILRNGDRIEIFSVIGGG